MSETVGTAAFSGLVDLAGDAVGGRALLASDEFFAEKENLTRLAEPIFDPPRYTDRGKWMDGWESRRKRVPGHDWCILKLGVPGRIRGVDIDTRHFLGNHPPFASLDACVAPADADPEALRDNADWTPLLAPAPLRRGSRNLFPIDAGGNFTHVRLNIHPDGGVARLRVYGEPAALLIVGADEEIDLAALVNGGKAVACSDMFFSPMENLILPGRSTYMGGGWETRRSRPPGMDWIILQLATPGVPSRFTIDTGFFKGNYPARAAIDGLYWPDAPAPALIDAPDWAEILPQTPLGPDQEHEVAAAAQRPCTHVRLRIYPDGGVARLRVWGRPTDQAPGEDDALVRHVNDLSESDYRSALARCCGSRRWVDAMMSARPFTSSTHLFGESDARWWRLGDGDWREAFTHHPRIGADVAKLREKYASTADWSAGEQAGVQGAAEATIQALAAGNRAYEERFGHIFIVCASGLSAAEMLARLQQRLHNEPAAELRIAAGEQAKITRLRLQKLAQEARAT